MNKYQEAKKWIEEIDSHSEWGHTEINWQAIDEIKELVSKKEKYRWHDLRKEKIFPPLNPLEDEYQKERISERVLVKTSAGNMHLDFRIRIRGGNEHWHVASAYGDKIIAWKYIEEFVHDQL